MAKRTLRDQQQELTRELIFEALVGIVLEEGVHAFTIQRVAERAGVSPRTIYRHFATRQDLLDQLGEWTQEQNEQAGLAAPTEADAIAGQARRLFAEWDADEAAVRAFVLLRITAGLQPRERTERVSRVDAAIDRWAPDAPEQYRRWARHTIRALFTTVTWLQMRDDVGISGEEAGDSVAYAIDLVLADLKRRSDQAQQSLEDGGTGGTDDHDA